MAEPQLVIIPMVEGDTLPILPFTMQGVDIAGYAITLHLQRKNGTVMVRPGVITDASAGRAAFIWVHGDIAMSDQNALRETQPAQIRITNAEGGVMTIRNIVVEVTRRIGVSGE